MLQILIFSSSPSWPPSLALYSVFGVARPIKHVSDAMEQVSSGDLTAAIPMPHPPDELGDQARALTVFRDGTGEADRLRPNVRAQSAKPPNNASATCTTWPTPSRPQSSRWVDTVASAATQLQACGRDSHQDLGRDHRPGHRGSPAAAAKMATTNVQTVAAAIEQLSPAPPARSAAARLARSNELTDRAVSEVDHTHGQMTELRTSADQIGTIIGLIDSIAGQDQFAGAERHHRVRPCRRGRPGIAVGRRK